MKKILAMLLCMLMVCSLAPTAAFAVDGHALYVENADFSINNSAVNQWPSGSFVTPNEPVLITAYADTADRQFDSWAASASTPANGSSGSTYSFSMPDADGVSVTAKYKYRLAVTDGANGVGAGTSGFYLQGSPVSLTAGTPAAGYRFSSWSGSTGVTFADANASSTTFSMPASAASVTANYTQVISSVSVSPASKSVTIGSTGAVLTAAATTTDSSAVTFNWYKCSQAGAKIGASLGSGTTLAIPTAADSGAGTYYYMCEASESNVTPMASANVAAVTVQSGLSVNDVVFGEVAQNASAPTKTISVVNNGSSALDVTAALSGVNADSFTLLKTAGTVPVGSDTSWTIQPKAATMTAGAATYYAKVIFTYAGGSAESVVTMTVTNNTPTTPTLSFTTPPQSQSVVSGSSVSLSAAATVTGATGTPTLKWYKCSDNSGTNASYLGTGSSLTVSTGSGGTLTQSGYVMCEASFTGATSVRSYAYITLTSSGTTDISVSVPSFSPADSAVKTIAITNTGTNPVTIKHNGVTVSPDTYFEVFSPTSDLVLSSGTPTYNWSIRPKAGIPTGSTTSATVSVTYYDANNVGRTKTATVTYQTGSLTVSPTSLDFGSVYAGYLPLINGSVTIANSSGVNIGNGAITVSSSAGRNTNFYFQSSFEALNSGTSKPYYIRPKDGLSAGTYTETLYFYNGSTYFSSVSVSLQVVGAVGYSVTSGAGQYWYRGSTKLMSFVCNGDYSKFTGITIDGSSAYTYTRNGDRIYNSAGYVVAYCSYGSTNLTFSEYLQNSLGAGTYTLRFNYTDGYADTYFRVYNGNGSPPTGDNSNIALWIGLLACSGVAAVIVVPKLLKRKGKKD